MREKHRLPEAAARWSQLPPHHQLREIEDENQKQSQSLLFWRNVTFLGAALALFAFFAAFGHDLPLTLTDPLFDLRE